MHESEWVTGFSDSSQLNYDLKIIETSHTVDLLSPGGVTTSGGNCATNASFEPTAPMCNRFISVEKSPDRQLHLNQRHFICSTHLVKELLRGWVLLKHLVEGLRDANLAATDKFLAGARVVAADEAERLRQTRRNNGPRVFQGYLLSLTESGPLVIPDDRARVAPFTDAGGHAGLVLANAGAAAAERRWGDSGYILVVPVIAVVGVGRQPWGGGGGDGGRGGGGGGGGRASVAPRAEQLAQHRFFR